MKSIFVLRKHADNGAPSEDGSLETALAKVVNQHSENLVFVEEKAVRVDLLSQDLLQHGQLRDRRAQGNPAIKSGEIPATPKETH